MSPQRACIISTCPKTAIPGGSRCESHARSNWDKWKKRKAERQAYYASPKWRARRARQLEEFPNCAQCGAKASHADHIDNMAAGGDPDGPLQSLCESCHRHKTASEGGRARKATSRATNVEPPTILDKRDGPDQLIGFKGEVLEGDGTG